MSAPWRELRSDPAYVLEAQALCLGSFKHFCILAFRFAYQKEFIWAEHHGIIAKALMRVWLGEDRNLIVNLPPRYSKTEMMCLFAAWCYAHNDGCEFLHLSYSSKLACKNSNKVRTLVKSQWFQDCFHVLVNPDIDSQGEWATKAGGIFKADSAGGQVTGFGAGSTTEVNDQGEFVFSGCILIDDPLKPSDAHTVERGKVNENWEETIKSRRNSPQTTPTICIMQRLHEGDFTAELRADVAEEFKVLSLKALRDDGTALWPAKHRPEQLEAIRDRNIFVFSGQYQQDPTPKGGTIFRSEWWQYCFEFPQFEKVEIFADTALKTKEVHDYSVFQAWGLYKGRIYLIDQVRGKWEAPELKRVTISFIKRIKAAHPRFYRTNIEDKASGTGLIQSIRRDALCTVNAVQRNVDKVTRAYDAAPYVQSGSVVLLVGAPHNGIFIAECSSFNAEGSHLHDDQVDPFMDATSALLGQASGGSSIMVC